MKTPTRALVLLLAAAGPAAAQGSDPAQVLPFRTLLIRAPISGQVRSLAVDFGDVVEAGQPLMTLEAPELEAARRRAEIGVESAHMQLKITELHREIAELELSIAQRREKVAAEALPRAQEQLAAAEAHVARLEQLFEAGRMASEAIAQARLELGKHRERWAAAGEQVKTAEDEVRIATLLAREAEVQIDLAQAERHAREIELRLASERLEQTQLRSPFAGRVTSVLVAAGETVQAQETGILELVDMTRVRIRFALPESLARTVKVGSPAELLVGSERIRAEVAALSGVLDPQNRSMTGEIILDNPEGDWIPGSLVRVAFTEH